MAETRVYRLDVWYPSGDRYAEWEPPGWDETSMDPDTGAVVDVPFRWPMVRQYLSKNGAETRAKLLRSYGATVTVVASEPVTWP